MLAKDVNREAQKVNASSTGERPACPRCGTERPYFLSTRKIFKCRNKECHHQFSSRSHTDLRSNKIPASVQDALLADATNSNLSARALAEKHGVDQKTAWTYQQKAKVRAATEDTPND